MLVRGWALFSFDGVCRHGRCGFELLGVLCLVFCVMQASLFFDWGFDYAS